jgi:cellulose/xylan binding protein with CBM9 domain
MDTLSCLCKRTQTPIVIDGKLDDPAWQLAEPIRLRRNQDGAAPRFSTTARLLWDKDYLYVGYFCEDHEILSTMTQRDAFLWEEEVVEIFVDANGDRISYIEIEVNPLNTLLDLFALNRSPYPARYLFDWNSDEIRHAVTVDGDPHRRDTQDRSWSVEIAMPWQDFVTAPHVPPCEGDVWRINLYRIDQYRGQEELYAWSPTECATFHVPERFGELIFVA